MLDILTKADLDKKVRYVFFDTGIEYTATKEHLAYLEKKYNIVIERVRASCPVSLGCKKYGLPFISKDISSKINVLQNHNFDFNNDGHKNFDELHEKYSKPKSCDSVLKWWCNIKPSNNIKDNKKLKEFLIEHPPEFKISSRCCEGAKKHPSKQYEIENNIDLKCMGIRRSEGGVRSSSYKNCFTEDKTKHTQIFLPIFWFTDEDKREYENHFDITHSKCYTDYGYTRTGCAGCSFNSKFNQDIDIIKDKEPMLYKAINNIFGKVYEYTNKYKKYKKGESDD